MGLFANNLIKRKVPVIFDFRHLSLLLGYEPYELAFYLYAKEEMFYTEMKVPKKNGGSRIISIPSENLKTIQRWILDNILIHYELHEQCVGFRKGYSIVNNAEYHVDQDCVSL